MEGFTMHTKSIAGSIFLAMSLMFGTVAMAADATPDQVYQAAQAGNYRAARQMMDQILRDHPDSAKAHFVEAELLGKQGRLRQARQELDTALRLDPAQHFARPGAVDGLRTLIASGSASHARGTFSGIPWGLILAVAGLLAIVSLIMRARRRAAYAAGANAPYGSYGSYGPYGRGLSRAAQPSYGGGPQGGYGYPGGVGPMGGGLGSGIMGGLATGAAVGAGVVAGEALMNRVLNGGPSNASGSAGNVVDQNAAPDAGAANQAETNYDMGGNDFGLRDAGSWDDGSGSGSSWDDPDAARRLTRDDGGWTDSGQWDNGGSWDNGNSWDDGSFDNGGGSDDWT
jgi:hypothetical protein